MIYRRFYNHPGTRFENVFQELDRMRRQLDQVFEGDSNSQRGLLGSGVFPQINLTEDAERFYIRAELPGVKADEIQMEATGKNLSISGERKIESENEGVRYHRRERESGNFSRMIAMPTDIDPERIEAKLENGILTIRVPKAEAVKPRQIAIN